MKRSCRIRNIKTEIGRLGREMMYYGSLDNTPDELQRRYQQAVFGRTSAEATACGEEGS